MSGEAIITVSAATVALTQLVKWAGLPDRWGPLAVVLLAALGVALWVYTQGELSRAAAFDVFAGWVAVATSAAGVFGFSRAAADTLTKMTPPPSGAGAERRS